MKEKWLVHSKKADFNAIAAKYHISPITARIIRNRDYIEDIDINLYLNGSLGELHSPWLLKDMDKAVSIIENAIDNKQSIRVVGDYDIDGVCAGNVLVKGLEMAGAFVSFAVPDRIIDGYGINERIIEEAYEDGIDLIVTCDNGIAAIPAIRRAKELGMTVVVTDHHEVPAVLPEADAIVDAKQKDCKYPFKEICGAVVALKVITALFEKMNYHSESMDGLYELAGIATIGDVVDLRDENRIIAKYALNILTNTKNPGIASLKKVNNLDDKKISSYHVGFVLGPCLNAGGRLDTALKSYELLADNSVNSYLLAMELKELNDDRKQMTIDNVDKAIEMIDSDEGYQRDTVLVIFLEKCHESLAGIVAGRIRERYNKPTYVLTNADNGIKGSGRSIEGYNMFEELNKVSDLLSKYGGHEMAAGLSLPKDNLESFREAVNRESALTEDDLVAKVWIDVPLPFNYVTETLINELELLEPFGKGNVKPVFAERAVAIRNIRIFGQNRNVIRISMQNESGYRMDGTLFMAEDDFISMMSEKFGENETGMALNGEDNDIRMNITYYPEIDEYRGNRYVKVVITRIM